MAAAKIILSVLLFTALIAASGDIVFAAEMGQALPESREEPQVVERIIKIEGMVEKPRVLFIVSRAKVWKEYSFQKSFYKDILKPVYPETVERELLRSSDNNLRR